MKSNFLSVFLLVFYTADLQNYCGFFLAICQLRLLRRGYQFLNLGLSWLFSAISILLFIGKNFSSFCLQKFFVVYLLCGLLNESLEFEILSTLYFLSGFVIKIIETLGIAWRYSIFQFTVFHLALNFCIHFITRCSFHN